MFAAVVIFNEEVKEMQRWGYLGAFVISILGGATIIVPVPMLAVVFALAGAWETPGRWRCLAFRGRGRGDRGGDDLYDRPGAGGPSAPTKTAGSREPMKNVRLDRAPGRLALFVVTFIVNPFFYPAAFACGALRIGLRKYPYHRHRQAD